MDRGYLFYLGKEVELANEIAKKDGKTLRVVEKDGVKLVISLELMNNRINVAVENNIIVSIKGVY